MRILIDSYCTVMQNGGGGVQMRIGKMLQYLHRSPDVSEVKLFNKFCDRIADYDILHIFKNSVESVGIISYAKSCGLKIVLSSVVPQMQASRIRIALGLQRLVKLQNTFSMLRQGLLLSDAIVAQTIKEADFIEKTYDIDRKRITVIPNGVKERLLDNYDATTQKDLVLCVGRFDHNKNQLSLLKAIKGLGIPVHFVGGPAVDEQKYYEQCIAEGKNEPNIFFHGWLHGDSDKLDALYRRAKVVVLVSHKEIFGNSLVEGAAVGANLVSSRSLPTHEWGFDEHCIRVSPDSIAEIRQGILHAYKMPLSLSLHQNAKELFSWHNVTQRYIDIYKSVLEC